MKSLIVVPTHRTGVKFLENLFASFHGYDKYPILVVINDYQRKDEALFQGVVRKSDTLPISLKRTKHNSFELGGLYVALKRTDYDEFFLLPHSCEIINTELFDIVFEEHKGRSVAFSLQTGDWRTAIGANREYEKHILDHLDRSIHEKLTSLGVIQFWQGHVGKYRRVILERMRLEDYLPTNMIEAISKSELLFSSTYHSLDPSTIVLFPDWIDGAEVVEKFGKQRKRISNEYIVKWKTHWNVEMVFGDLEIKSSPQVHPAELFIEQVRRMCDAKGAPWIWGAGAGGKRVAARMDDAGIPYLGFLDSDPARRGTLLEGHPVEPPEVMNQREPAAVIVASLYATEICAHLAMAGRVEGEDFLVAPLEALAAQT